jgi:hypothetical protein
MRALTSALLGTTALAIMALGAATPAQARSEFGVYVSPYSYGVSYRDYCRQPWYRPRYWYYCRQFYGDGDYDNDDNYRYNYNYYDNDDWRRRHHRHHHDRDDWGGEGERHDRDWDDRRRHHHDGGEGNDW